MNSKSLKYVLVTPARNEEAFIELTIKSVIAQKIRPVKWIIVSDGSKDRTDEIVLKHADEHDWIELLRMPERNERDFGGKALSFNAGWKRISHLDYDIIGNIDADLSFESDVMSFLLDQFEQNPGLGVAGVPFTEGKGFYDFRFSSVEHVSGACQLFRRHCFDEIGGYRPMKGGGIDVMAVLMARLKGWQTRTFPQKSCFHHRLMGAAKHKAVIASFKLGEKDYMLGRHPLWQLFRSFYQMRRSPFLVGGAMLFGGYFWFALKREKRCVPEEIVKFQRREQMARLKQYLTGRKLHTPVLNSSIDKS